MNYNSECYTISHTQTNVYDLELNMDNLNSSHTKILNFLKRGQTILEIGCATGYMTRYMREMLNCQVVGVELNPMAAKKAESYCEKIFIGDISEILKKDELSERKFDVIIMADVIEHLKDAVDVLIRLKQYLKEDGYLLMSVPNTAHGSVALELLDGNFEYRSLGLLDRTHIFFYDRYSLFALLEKTGYLISRLDRVIIHPKNTEMKTLWEKYPREITAYIEKVNPEYQTYQFVIKIYPTSLSGWQNGLQDMVKAQIEKNSLLNEKLLRNKKEKKKLQNYFSNLEQEIENYKLDIQKLRESLSKISFEKSVVQSVNEDYKFKLQRLGLGDIQDLDKLEKSIIWQLSCAYRNHVERWLPQGSKRRYIYQSVVSRVAALLN